MKDIKKSQTFRAEIIIYTIENTLSGTSGILCIAEEEISEFADSIRNDQKLNTNIENEK